MKARYLTLLVLLLLLLMPVSVAARRDQGGGVKRGAVGSAEDILGEIAQLKSENAQFTDRLQTLWNNADARLKSSQMEIKRLGTENGQLTFQLQAAQAQIGKDKAYISQLESRIGKVVGHLEDAAEASNAYADNLSAATEVSASLTSTGARRFRKNEEAPKRKP